MDPSMEAILSQLIDAISAMMNPMTPQEIRHKCYEACEDFKENSPVCVQVGMLLSTKQYDQYVRHFGLQLLEHSIRYRWNNMSPRDKLFIKTNVMKLLDEGTHGLLEEEAHIKDALSKIVVEMIKREWPQHWPQLLTELNELCSRGAKQTDLVLLILCRLSEDVVLFQSVPSQRRREIYTTLTAQMSNIYLFFLNTLEQYFSLLQNQPQLSQMLPNGNHPDPQPLLEAAYICRNALNTLAVYVDWIAMSYIFEKNSLLLQLLCSMLQNEELQLAAAECLLIITNRKGKLEDRKPLLVLFSEDAMQAIFKAAIAAANAALEERHYLFFKRLCQVLIAMGTQLSALWGSAEKIERPITFRVYLDTMLAFTDHSSQTLASYTMTLWSMLFRHEHIRKDDVFLGITEKLLGILGRQLSKVGLPSQTNHTSCEYSRLEFDQDEEFNMFFSKYRAEIAEVVRFVTLAAPRQAFQTAAAALQRQLTKPVDLGDVQVGSDGEHCRLTSPSFIEWDALSVFVECVMTKATKPEFMQMFVKEGIELLHQVLQYDTKDPLILSSVLSCISSLFPFIVHKPSVLHTVLDKIFCTAVFHIEGQTKATRSRAVRNVRRHACSILVKLSKAYPDLLLPGFEQLYKHIGNLSSDPEELSHLEKLTLLEALILISNQFHDYEKQSAFLGQIMSETREVWLCDTLKQAISKPEHFVTYVGLDQPPVEPSSADTCGINRSYINNSVNMILAVMKRSNWPTDVQTAKKGNFVLTSLPDGTLVFRNPAAKHIFLLLENVFVLARTLNEIWLPQHLALRHPDFSKAYDLTTTDRFALLGIHPPITDNTSSPHSKHPLDRMQSFSTLVYETCAHILGNAGASLGVEFYQAHNLANSIINSYLSNLDAIPDFRLRIIIRNGLKPLVQACPTEHYTSVVIPILSVFSPYMLQWLTSKWQNLEIHLSRKTEDDDTDDPESDEVISEQLVRLISREYLDFLTAVFREKRGANVESNQEDAAEDGDHPPPQHGAKDERISDLGTAVLKTDGLFSCMVLTLYTALGWSDSTTCHKCISLCWPVLKPLLARSCLTVDDACHLFKCVLIGMNCHGQHEATQAMLLSLALQVYENLRPVFPEVRSVLRMVPNVTDKAIQQFDEKLLSQNQAKLPEKRKKEAFKKLIQEVIGQNVGQKFKKEVHIKNLPPLIKASKPKVRSLDEQENRDIGLCGLFAPDYDS